MVLNDIDIRNRIREPQKYGMNAPLIQPFLEKRLQGASYDVTITDEIVYINPLHQIVDIKDQHTIDQTYYKTHVTGEGFILYPNSYILVTLNETLYVPKNLVAHLRPKTRFIRLGLLISGQHINPDSICKLNIGIYNATPNPIRLYPGISIGQIVFETMTDAPSKEKWYLTKNDAHYQNDIEFIGAKTDDEFEEFLDDEIDKLLNSGE